MTADDEALVERAQAGDTAAREAIADAWRDRILRYITTMIGDPNLAEDLTQESFGKAFAKITELRNPERLGAWLYTIAVNACRRHLRDSVDKSKPQNSAQLESDPMGPRQSILSAYVQRESAAALAIAIDRLPILLREAFVLHLIEGLPYTEIAEITGATKDALHVRTHRAKALLRRQLGSVVDTFWVERR